MTREAFLPKKFHAATLVVIEHPKASDVLRELIAEAVREDGAS